MNYVAYCSRSFLLCILQCFEVLLRQPFEKGFSPLPLAQILPGGTPSGPAGKGICCRRYVHSSRKNGCRPDIPVSVSAAKLLFLLLHLRSPIQTDGPAVRGFELFAGDELFEIPGDITAVLSDPVLLILFEPG